MKCREEGKWVWGCHQNLKKNGFLDFYPVDKYPEIAGLLSSYQVFRNINPEIAGY